MDTLGLTWRRVLCIVSESLFLIVGIIIGTQVLPEMSQALEQGEFEPHPFLVLGMEWYWVLLVALGVHILLWPIVARLLGFAGAVLWYALGAALPVMIVGVPALFVISAYTSVIQ